MLIPYLFEPEVAPINVNTTYTFHTRKGHVYGLTFIEATRITELLDDYPVISNAIYVTLDVLKQDGPLSFDCRIGITVVEIIKHYLSNNDINSILVYNCATDEGKQLKRNDKFHRWFNDFAQDYQFVKIDCELLEPTDDGHTSTFISVLFVSTHPRRPHILEEMKELSQAIGINK